jgi:hypothetical protein
MTLPPLPPQTEGQARTMTKAGVGFPGAEERGHWFSPDAVRDYATAAVQAALAQQRQPLTEEEIEQLALQHEDFGFGRVDERGLTTHGFDPDGLRSFVTAAMQAAVLAEREACAKQLDALGNDHCAAAIRARMIREQEKTK